MVSILNVDGSLFSAFLTNAANHLITPEHLTGHIELLRTASFLLADANISVDTAEWLLLSVRNRDTVCVRTGFGSPSKIPPTLF
ncbi:MAG: hypothetical protein IPK57_15670 [Chitinophagaceae bacterium]|nr:hypothetical protein [Chitinophagaceae bacterium]